MSQFIRFTLVFFITCFCFGCSNITKPDNKVVVAIIENNNGEKNASPHSLTSAANIAFALNTSNGTVAMGKKKVQLQFVTLPLPNTPSAIANTVKSAVVTHNAVAIIGGNTQESAQAIAAEAKKLGVPHLSSINTLQALVTNEHNSFITMPHGNVTSEAAAYFMLRELYTTRLAILYDMDDVLSTSIAEAEQKAFMRLGGQKVIKVGFSSSEPLDNVLPQLVHFRPEVVFMAFTKQLPFAAMAKLSDLGYFGHFFSGTFQHSVDLETINHPATLYTLALWNPHHLAQQSKRYVDEYKRLYSQLPSTQDAINYDTVLRLIASLYYSDTTSAASIHGALAFYSFFEGVAGSYTFSAASTIKTVWIIKVEQGIITYSKQFDPSKTQ